MLELDSSQRIVTWKNSKKQTITHTFRRLRQDDWDGYFSRIVIETEEGARTVDLNSAAIWLWDRCVVSTQAIVDRPDWKERTPLADRLQAVRLLGEVSVGTVPEGFEPDVEVVSLDCLWNAAPVAPGLPGESNLTGAMAHHTGLLHRLAFPSAEQMMRYSRETSRSLIVGGSRNRRTRYPASQRVLLSLYDELISAVDGYSCNGHELKSVENIRANMDATHKVAAVSPLFATAPDLAAEEGEAN